MLYNLQGIQSRCLQSNLKSLRSSDECFRVRYDSW